MNPVAAVIYIFCLTDEKYVELARRFIDSYMKYPAGYPHSLIVVFNGEPATGTSLSFYKSIFFSIPCIYMSWDDTGWDIGAYRSVCQEIIEHKADIDMVMCCGGPTHFKKSGWLKRMAESWNKHGKGLYGSSASYEMRPHIQTSGFCCPPSLVAEYPHPLTDRLDRYNFEWGKDSILTRAKKLRLPCMLVTWDGEWHEAQWRLPDNVYRKGDQSNCLAYFLHSDEYDSASEEGKRISSRYPDGLHNSSPGNRDLREQIDIRYKQYGSHN